MGMREPSDPFQSGVPACMAQVYPVYWVYSPVTAETNIKPRPREWTPFTQATNLLLENS
jgi:hypothetical protein